MPSLEEHRADIRDAMDRERERIQTDHYREMLGRLGGPLHAEPPLRAAILDEAKQAVCSDRNAEYGEPIDNFGRWAGACNALGYQGPGGRQLKPHDLAVIMGLGKLSRSVQSPDKRDTWVDLAGYAAVGYELVTLEGE